MFTSTWKWFLVSCLCCVAALAAGDTDNSEECRRAASGQVGWGVIYVVCPDLPRMPLHEMRAVVIEVLDGTSRRAGEVSVFFFTDEFFLRRQRRPGTRKNLFERWGRSLVGVYQTGSEVLTVRTINSKKWRELHLPTDRNRS